MAKAKTATKKSSSSKSKEAPMRSFHRSPDQPPFFSYRITQQSIYWLILCLLVLALGIWVITLSVRVQSLYDQVETTSSQLNSSPSTKE